jgi:hypothetical protein
VGRGAASAAMPHARLIAGTSGLRLCEEPKSAPRRRGRSGAGRDGWRAHACLRRALQLSASVFRARRANATFGELREAAADRPIADSALRTRFGCWCVSDMLAASVKGDHEQERPQGCGKRPTSFLKPLAPRRRWLREVHPLEPYESGRLAATDCGGALTYKCCNKPEPSFLR